MNLINYQLKLTKMKKTICTILLAIAISTPSVQAQEKSIFNGNNLDGWTIYGTEKWYVEDGLLICESGPDKQ